MTIKRSKKESPKKRAKRRRAPPRLVLDVDTVGRLQRDMQEAFRSGRPDAVFRDEATHLTRRKLAKAQRAASVVNTGELLARVCKAASERWPEDKSRPGVQVAHIPEVPVVIASGMRSTLDHFGIGQPPLPEPKPAQWYVALHRYEQTLGERRVVAFKTYNEDLDAALLEVAKFVAQPTEERDALARELRGVK